MGIDGFGRRCRGEVLRSLEFSPSGCGLSGEFDHREGAEEAGGLVGHVGSDEEGGATGITSVDDFVDVVLFGVVGGRAFLVSRDCGRRKVVILMRHEQGGVVGTNFDGS